MKKENLLYKHIRLPLKILLIVFMSITVIGFTYKYFDTTDETKKKMSDLERSLQDLRAAMSVDSVRQYNIQKIMAIIDKYNKTMSSVEKYEIANEIYNMSLKYTNLDVDLICATITHESAKTWDPKVISQAGAIGLMQIMPATGMYLAEYEDITWTSPEEVLMNPIYNIRMGTRYLSTLVSYYGVDGGLAAYNGGEKQAALWLKKNKQKGILWAETENYIPAIIKLWDQYREKAL
ncbi:MAG: transglycosylase SLT domain-containing protein [candidate division KSB1 bacterium]|jgi:soluble lytic murein transglycosylase|nr:transglycosylase SLT domain-containing protein [candidate division KSB1 bacterium]MDZ7317914.1 transglycosylase SLT domain-containing protein [candidate division KSB1 bacterium]MDZ7339878.1 transglycosylase SLT domain-containing protein [candidate division KSB1 bacterium]